MGATVTTGNNTENTWGGGNEPMGASYGKLMMWFFIVSDALTFSGFLAAYGFSRFKFIDNYKYTRSISFGRILCRWRIILKSNETSKVKVTQ